MKNQAGWRKGHTIEATDLSSPRQFLKTLVAFANSAGGKLVFGVEDKTRKVIGVDNPLDEEERLCNLIADSIEPKLVPDVELSSHQNKTLVVVEVYPGSNRPYWLKSEGKEKGVFVRLGSTNRQADLDLVTELRRSAPGLVFDEEPLTDQTLDDLDQAAIQASFQKKKPLPVAQLSALRLVARHRKSYVPTVGGVLLFGKNRQELFPDAWVQCGRFTGKNRSHIFDHIEIHDYLPNLIEKIMDFFKKHAMRGADLSGLYRRDVWSIPLNILREAVVNALVHADYSQKGAPTRISMFDDRIEVENPGILLPGLSMEDLMEGVSKLRNRVIGRVFKELHQVEQWGLGIPRMLEEARKLRLQEPRFDEVGMRFRFTVFLGATESKGGATEPTTPHETHHDAQHDTPHDKHPTTTQVKNLVRILSTEMSRGQLLDSLGLKDRMHFTREYLKPALEGGLIEMTLPDKLQSKQQKYRLTEKGKKVRDTGDRQ